MMRLLATIATGGRAALGQIVRKRIRQSASPHPLDFLVALALSPRP